jgi:hypothetical protein
VWGAEARGGSDAALAAVGEDGDDASSDSDEFCPIRQQARRTRWAPLRGAPSPISPHNAAVRGAPAKGPAP